MPAATLPELLADLRRAFPRERNLTDDTIRLYLRDLADLPTELLAVALVELRRTSEFWPSIRAIREAVAELALGLPTEQEALEQVEARLAWGRDRQGDPPPLHDLVRASLTLVGGFPAWRSADSPAVVRGQLLRLYRDARARAVRDAQVGRTALGPASERKEIEP